MSVATESAETFASLNPATGEVVAEHPVRDAAAVAAAVERAREAAAWWRALGWKERRLRLLNIKGALARSLDRSWPSSSTGRTASRSTDAQLETITGGRPHRLGGPQRPEGPRAAHASAPASWRSTRRRAGVPAARRRRRDRPVELPGLHADGLDRATRSPRATPWCSSRSEYTPRSASGWSTRSPRSSRSSPVLQTGHRPRRDRRGAVPRRRRQDRLHRLGARPAKKVMAACAENLTPVLMECGGKDAMIVDDDADLDAAADAALWGAMSNAGQTCIGIERVYVVDEGLRRVPRRATEKAREAAARRRRGRRLRPDHDAGPGRRHRAAHRGRARPGRPGGRRRRRRRCGAVRRADRAGRRAGGLAPRCARRRSARPSPSPGQRRRRGGRAGQRHTYGLAGAVFSGRPARRWSSPAGCAPA